jgi:hypothetical protein
MPTGQQQGQQQGSTAASARLEAVMRLLLGAAASGADDEALDRAREQARRVGELSDEKIASLAGEEEPAPAEQHQRGGGGGFLAYLRGDAPVQAKKEHTGKQKRQADHIKESEESRGAGPEEAERIAWATVNKQQAGRGEGEKPRKKRKRKPPKEARRYQRQADLSLQRGDRAGAAIFARQAQEALLRYGWEASGQTGLNKSGDPVYKWVYTDDTGGGTRKRPRYQHVKPGGRKRGEGGAGDEGQAPGGAGGKEAPPLSRGHQAADRSALLAAARRRVRHVLESPDAATVRDLERAKDLLLRLTPEEILTIREGEPSVRSQDESLWDGGRAVLEEARSAGTTPPEGSAPPPPPPPIIAAYMLAVLDAGASGDEDAGHLMQEAFYLAAERRKALEDRRRR